MNDFELLRQLLFSDASIAAIDRIEAQAAADAELEVEIERLRQLNADLQAAWTRARQDMKTEIERLRAALEQEQMKHDVHHGQRLHGEYPGRDPEQDNV